METDNIEVDGQITSLEIDIPLIHKLIDMRRNAVDYILELTEQGEVKAKCPLNFISFKQ